MDWGIYLSYRSNPEDPDLQEISNQPIQKRISRG
jgi:hypothetical protein